MPLSESQLDAALAALDPRWAPPAKLRFENELQKGAAAIPGLEQKLADPDPSTRADAAIALGALKAGSAAAKLKALLADKFPPVRQAAAGALIALGDRALLNELIKGLADPDPKVIAGAAAALGTSSNPEVVPYLLQAFQTRDTAVGVAVATALGQLRAAAAVQYLVAALSANFVPAACCEALGLIGDGNAAPILLDALRHPDENVRASAARALGLLASSTSPRFDAVVRQNKAIPALKALAADPSPKVRLCASLSRLELSDESARPALKATLEQLAR